MAISRLATAAPAAADFGSGEALFTATADTLLSVIVANKSAVSQNTYVYVIPAGSELVESEWAILAYNLKIGEYNTYETFRFAMNTNDTLYVAGTGSLAYYVQGTPQ